MHAAAIIRRLCEIKFSKVILGCPVFFLIFQDFTFTDEMAHFNRERIPERVVHAKGGGMFSSFLINLEFFNQVLKVGQKIFRTLNSFNGTGLLFIFLITFII